MRDLLPITVVIPTKNEEMNLPTCLAKLSGSFVEVVVVDSGSIDATRKIAEDSGAKWVEFEWAGGYPKKRNWMLLNYKFVTQWVLFLDADEKLTDEFKCEVARKLEAEDHNGFWLNYRNQFQGKTLRHGVPQRKLALFRVGSGLYENIADPGWTNLDMEVHEHPVLHGRIGAIQAPIDHVDYRGLHHFIERHNDYSTWEAHRFVELHLDKATAQSMTNRQIAKYRFIDRWWFPPMYFLFTFVWKRGFFDGRAGLVYGIFKAYYFLQIREKVRELRRPGLK
jgi:glycosyltransferase involved in cell wall biosynthesis